MAFPAAAAASFALSGMTQAVAVLYGAVSDFNGFVDHHIQEMQASANSTIATTGRILEAAKYGFGMGYLSSVTIIATGQMLLGNTLAAVGTVSTAAVLANPMAMTCGAMGAIIFGWRALSDEQKNELLDKLSHGLEIGVELIRSIIDFVIRTGKELLSSQALKVLKVYIAEKAALFGKHLSDVTHLTVDVIADTTAAVRMHTVAAVTSTSRWAGEAADRVGESLSDITRAASDLVGEASDATGDATKKVWDGGKRLVQRDDKDKVGG